MDAKMERLELLLKSQGYTTKCAPENRRWFSFEAPDSSILQIVTENQYTRVTLMDDGSFRFSNYVSTEHPLKPKTEFFLAWSEQDFKTFAEVIGFVTNLGPRKQRVAA